jgi:hypothetical protein
MAHGSKRIFFVFLENNTDRRDDECLKVRAKTKPEAKKIAEAHCRSNFTVGKVLTSKGLKRYDPEWHALLWGQPAVE